jgi:type III secretion protein J
MKKQNLLIFALFLLSLFLSGCQMDLYSGLSENEANNMLSILLSNDINAEKIKNKKEKTFTLTTDKSKIPESVLLLKEHGYPKEKIDKMSDLFKQEGLVSSPTEERARYIYALSQSVQETLSNIDGVLIARVHIVMPENNPYTSKILPSSASVFIKYHPNLNLSDIKSEIKMIVEASIEGLTYDNVKVVLLPAQIKR